MRGRTAASIALAALLGLGITGCSVVNRPSPPMSGLPTSSARAATSPEAVSLVVSPEDGARKVRPDVVVKVTANGGPITHVTVSAEDGTEVPGTLSADGRVWQALGRLSPSRDYTVSASGGAPRGAAVTVTTRFSTLRPAQHASASLQPADGRVVGIGMPVVLTFARPVRHRPSVEAALSVAALPKTEGAWRWVNARQLQWRPKTFWRPGTRVRVVADLRGVEIAPGTWGTRSRSARFTVGSAMVSTVDLRAHTMTVRRGGKVLRVIPVTNGMPGLESRAGIKVIISRETSRRMDAATTGVPPGSPDYYNRVVQYAMRLTWSGEFIHAAPWSVASQGKANVSHGCTGMSTDDARWLFEQSKAGDVVEFVHGSRPLEDGNGYTAWNVPFSRWATG